MLSPLTQGRGLKQPSVIAVLEAYMVAPHAGAWIETRIEDNKTLFDIVAPHAGAWIETRQFNLLPSVVWVAPHAGAWIETYNWLKTAYKTHVAPHAGAWIETGESEVRKTMTKGRPSRRGVD